MYVKYTDIDFKEAPVLKNHLDIPVSRLQDASRVPSLTLFENFST